MSITDFILAEGRDVDEQGGLLPQAGSGRLAHHAEKTEASPSGPSALASVAELEERVKQAGAAILIRNTHLAEILDEGNNANNAWALRLHMDPAWLAANR